MKLEKRKVSGREKDEESVKLLGQLREKLHGDNPSIARRSAFNLSWMQEDGLDILKEALFGNFLRKTRSAAAYGLRNMRGRMKHIGLDVLNEGLKHPDRDTRESCKRALALLKERKRRKAGTKAPRKTAKFKIVDIANKAKRAGQARRLGARNPRRLQGKGFNRR